MMASISRLPAWKLTVLFTVCDNTSSYTVLDQFGVNDKLVEELRSAGSKVGFFSRAVTSACFSADGSFPVISDVLHVTASTGAR